MQINIPDNVSMQLQKRVNESSEFGSVEAYVNYILGEVLKQTEEKTETTPAEQPASGFENKDQEDAVKNRLESLGYLD